MPFFIGGDGVEMERFFRLFWARNISPLQNEAGIQPAYYTVSAALKGELLSSFPLLYRLLWPAKDRNAEERSQSDGNEELMDEEEGEGVTNGALSESRE